MSPRPTERDKRVRSALWAAYGDVLGFPTELVDVSGVRRRIGTEQISHPVAWTRRVGGRFGATVELPAGIYSDDTQLRLATSRSIAATGTFDVEAFSKIELPVWSAYALGGGRGTRAAASALSKRSTSWVRNFEMKEAEYTNGGGNGAAMRVQPHVWAARTPEDPASYMSPMIRNALCTHGHFRGIIGACFHGALLGFSLATGSVPSRDGWLSAVGCIQSVPQLIREDEELTQFWVPTWELRTGSSIEEAANAVVRELTSDLALIEKLDLQKGADSYGSIVEALGGTRPDWRGSGTRTALLAAVLAHLYRDSPEEGLLTAANALGTDTDTIATMAGALLGVSAKGDPPGPILDASYIGLEAARLAQIASQGSADAFVYPDLLRWTPPKSQLDVVGQAADRMAVSGLGYASPRGDIHAVPGNADKGWQFVQLEFLQTLLIKRRARLADLPPTALPYSEEEGITQARRQPTKPAKQSKRTPKIEQPGLFDGVEEEVEVAVAVPIGSKGIPPDLANLHEATKLAWGSQLDPTTVGAILMALAERDDGIELAMGFAAIVAKAKKTQSDRERGGA